MRIYNTRGSSVITWAQSENLQLDLEWLYFKRISHTDKTSAIPQLLDIAESLGLSAMFASLFCKTKAGRSGSIDRIPVA